MATHDSAESDPEKGTEGQPHVIQVKPLAPMIGDDPEVMETTGDPAEHSASVVIMSMEVVEEIGAVKQSNPSPKSIATGGKTGGLGRLKTWKHRKAFLYVTLWLLVTSWWITGLVLHADDKNRVIPGLFWAAISLRVFTLLFTMRRFTKALGKGSACVSGALVSRLDERLRFWMGTAVALLIMLVITYATPETPDNTYTDRTIGALGFCFIILVFWGTSHHRRQVNWRTVIVGILLQFLLGVLVTRSQLGRDIFEFVASLANIFLGFSKVGLKFVLTGSDDFVDNTIWFLLNVGPPIIFFVAVIQMLSFWGWTQWLVGKFAAFFFHTMRVSGVEAVVAAASPILGAGESAVLVTSYLPYLTSAETHQIMCSGMSTIAGSVLYAFISMGVSGKVVLSSCVMSIPSSLAISKLRYPEIDEPLTARNVVIPPTTAKNKPHNSLQALADGTWLGIKVAAMVCSTVLVLISLVGLVDSFLGWAGSYLDQPNLHLSQILGYPMYPIAFLSGITRDFENISKVAELLGTKIVINEFKAYQDLMGQTYAGISPRSRLISMYALCGFGNIGSVGIILGLLTQLAPESRSRVASVAWSALISGCVATLTSACIAGILITDAEEFLK